MLVKTRAIDRIIQGNPYLNERRYGLPFIGVRNDNEKFNPAVQDIADAIDYYGYGVRDENITTIPDTDLGSGNPMKFKPFPLSIEEMKKSLDFDDMYRYPYTEGDDNIRKKLLEYVESIGFINTHPYSYEDIDEKGLCVHNITFLPSTSIIFNLIVEIISRPGDVILITGPSYGLFTIRAERAGANVEIIDLEKKDGYLINPKKLADKIDDINESLQKVCHRRKDYVPRVVAFLNANPNNPTGKVMGEKQAELLTQIGQVCLERGVFIIDDLVYRDISYDGNNLAKPIASIPINGMFQNTISLFGLSKSYGLAKQRAGFVVADEVIIRELVNKTFQSMDSPSDFLGRALVGAFQVSKERDRVYNEYFSELRKRYVFKFNLLKALVSGIDSISNYMYKKEVVKEVEKVLGKDKDKLLESGIPYANLIMEPEAGFFAMLDFTQLKGMKYNGSPIYTEKDLLDFFYKEFRLRFLVGQSFSWPYKNQLVGRITFAYPNEVIIKAFMNMYISLNKLTEKEQYIIRKNELKDQEQMAHIKVDGWKGAYDRIVASKYLNALDYEQQTRRYIESFEEYKDRVLVAVKDDEVLGYSCFDPKASELVSLYVKPSEKGKGIGTALFKETCKELAQQGCKIMTLWCLEENSKAIEFYKKLSGKIIETKDAKIGDETYLEYGIYFSLEKVLSK